MQAMLDGNWSAIRSMLANFRRWYPPLISLLGLIAVGFARQPPVEVWLELAPWLNLLVTLAFFGMARRLFDLPTAVVALALYVLVDPLIGRPEIVGGYTPWPLAPSLASGGFFLSIWAIHARGASGQWHDAVILGAALGLVFLAHPAPALLLVGVITVVALSGQGVRLRTLLWLALAGTVQVSFALLYLGPLWLRYRLNWSIAARRVHRLGDDAALWHRILRVSLPGMLAMPAAWLLGGYGRVGRRTLAILVAWIGACAAMLLRHYGCTLLEGSNMVCRAVMLPAHHFQLYLSLAFTLVLAHGLVASARALRARPRRLGWAELPALLLILLALAVDGRGMAMQHDYNSSLRAIGLRDGDRIDWEAYLGASEDPAGGRLCHGRQRRFGLVSLPCGAGPDCCDRGVLQPLS